MTSYCSVRYSKLNKTKKSSVLSVLSCVHAIRRITGFILDPQCLPGYGVPLNSCGGITSHCDFSLPLLLFYCLLCPLYLNSNLPPSFAFTQILKAQYLQSHAVLHICACTNLLYIFRFWILHKILISSMPTRTTQVKISHNNWHVLLFAGMFCNFSFAAFP